MDKDFRDKWTASKVVQLDRLKKLWAAVSVVLFLWQGWVPALCYFAASFAVRFGAPAINWAFCYPLRNKRLKEHLEHALKEAKWEEWGGAADKKHGLKILDFGCGMGHTSQLLRSMFGQDVDITGVDVYTSEAWVGGPTKRLQYDGNALPFDDDSFDLVIACQVLHHVDDNAASVAELTRVSRGTVLIVEDLVLEDETAKATYFVDSFCNWDWRTSPPHTNRSHDGWMALFAKNRLASQHFHSCCFLARPHLYEDDWMTVRAVSKTVNGVYVLRKE